MSTPIFSQVTSATCLLGDVEMWTRDAWTEGPSPPKVSCPLCSGDVRLEDNERDIPVLVHRQGSKCLLNTHHGAEHREGIRRLAHSLGDTLLVSRRCNRCNLHQGSQVLWTRIARVQRRPDGFGGAPDLLLLDAQNLPLAAIEVWAGYRTSADRLAYLQALALPWLYVFPEAGTQLANRGFIAGWWREGAIDLDDWTCRLCSDRLAPATDTVLLTRELLAASLAEGRRMREGVREHVRSFQEAGADRAPAPRRPDPPPPASAKPPRPPGHPLTWRDAHDACHLNSAPLCPHESEALGTLKKAARLPLRR